MLAFMGAKKTTKKKTVAKKAAKRKAAPKKKATPKKAAKKKAVKRSTVVYALEQLFTDQDNDFVIDCIAPVLAWVPGKSKAKSRQPFKFPVDHVVGGKTTHLRLALTWDMTALAKRVPGVEDHARRLRERTSAQREHVTELATYGLSLVAISVLLPGRRVVGYMQGAAPDILLDVTPKQLRGVEAAGRSRGGENALLAIRTDKVPGLLGRSDITEVHLSLWCASARHGIMEQVKP